MPRTCGSRCTRGFGVEAEQREKLERLSRYVSRPPVAIERLALTAQGRVRYRLKTPYRDGTTHIVLEPLDFIARLAAQKGRAKYLSAGGIFNLSQRDTAGVDLTVNWQRDLAGGRFGDRLRLRGGIDNVSDTEPPVDGPVQPEKAGQRPRQHQQGP